MNRFISTLLIGCFSVSIAFSGYVKVPKHQKMQYKIEPAQSEHVNYFHGSTPITMPNTRNSGSFALIDSSTNGYGMVSANTRPLFVDVNEGNWFTCYRQYAGELTTHGQIGAAFSDDGEDWSSYTNINYNGNPPWGGGGVGGTGVGQGRYPSALGTEDQPLAIWNEYTAGNAETGSLYGGRPYYAYDSFGWDGGSFSYPTDIDPQWEGTDRDLWVGSPGISYDEDSGMSVVNTVYNDWTRGDRWLFHSEAYEDGFVVFGQEYKVMDETLDLLGGDDAGSYNTSAYMSFTPEGLGAVGLVGLFAGADPTTPTGNAVSEYHTGIFRLSDDHGATWGGCGDDVANGCTIGASGMEYAFIPDSVWDDLISTQFGQTLVDECEGTSHVLDDFWSYYEDDFKVDSEGNPHFLIQVLPCESTEDGSCWYTAEAGLYHFTADRDDLGTAGAWDWSFVMTGESTWSFADMSGESYIQSQSSSLSFSADNTDVVYVTTAMATPGDAENPSLFEDPCYVTLMSDYPSWSEDLYVIKSEDGGSSWWNPYNASNTPDESGGVCPGVGVTKCDPAETYPHAAHFGTDNEVYVMYQMPNWAFNEIGDMLGADFMNRLYAGTVVLDDSDIPEYGALDTGSSCYADPGDITGDGITNVLDIVGLVNHILGANILEDTCAADFTGDGIVNVLDIVGLVNVILGNRAEVLNDANAAVLAIGDSFISIEADGLVQGIQIELNHGSDFSIELENEYINEYYTSGNTTNLIVVSDGSHSLSKIATVSGEFNIISSSASNSESVVPLTYSEVSDFTLSEAFPNPFNPSTTIELDLNKEAFVSIGVYNIAGQIVDQIHSGTLSSSNHGFTWDASLVSSGIYFMSIQVDDQMQSKKLMLIK